MYDLNLPDTDVPPHLLHARSTRVGATAGILRAGIAAIGKGFEALAAAHARRRQRWETARQLRNLPDHALRDIGLPRSEIWKVASDLANEAARTPRPFSPRHAGRR